MKESIVEKSKNYVNKNTYNCNKSLTLSGKHLLLDDSAIFKQMRADRGTVQDYNM